MLKLYWIQVVCFVRGHQWTRYRKLPLKPICQRTCNRCGAVERINEAERPVQL